MCLVLLAHRVDPRRPLLLLGNRDEFHARPSAAAAPWPEDPRVVGGRDLQAGGAWLGLRADGHFAVVTNRRQPQLQTTPRSRGALVRDYLLGDFDAADFAAQAAREHAVYGPFNLLLGDAEAAFGVDGVSGRAFVLEPGLHVMSNGPWHARWPKTERLREGAAVQLADGANDDALLDLLADTAQPADAALPDTGVGLERERLLAPIFIRGADYGTRACSLIRVNDDGIRVLRERRYVRDGVAQGEARWRRDPGAARWAPD